MDLLMGIMHGICRSEVKPSMKKAVLQDTYAYYSRKSSEWIVQYPLQDYLAKVSTSVLTNESTSRYYFLFSLLTLFIYVIYRSSILWRRKP
jgi:hypothetical protein